MRVDDTEHPEQRARRESDAMRLAPGRYLQDRDHAILRIFSVLDGTESRYLPPGDCEYGTYPASVENEAYRVVELSAYGKRLLKTCVDIADPLPPCSDSTP